MIRAILTSGSMRSLRQTPGQIVCYQTRTYLVSPTLDAKKLDLSRRLCGGALDLAFKAEVLELAVKRRAADPEPARHFRHVAAVVTQSEADDIRFKVIKLANLAALIDEGHPVRITDFNPHDLANRGGGGVRQGGGRRDAYIETFDLRRDLGKFGDREFVAVGEHHGAEHGVFELAHVAGPVVADQKRQRLGRDPTQPLAFLGRKAREKGAREVGDILSSRSKRGQRHREHVEAVKQVLAEATLFDEVQKALVGR